jgi:hypothetical protein
MLKKSHISNIQIYTNEWDIARLGRGTSSNISHIMGEKFTTQDCVSYVYQKAGELITMKSTALEEDVIEDENTAWGRENEPAAIRRFGQIKQIEFLVTQKLIMNPDSHFSSTPDAIWIHSASVLKDDEYNVSTLEVKCPRKYPRYIPLWQCQTPEDLKKFSKKYYWQVIDQMDNCDSHIGYFACFHPLFPEATNMRIIEFRKIDMWPDFIKLKERKAMFVKYLDAIRLEFAPTVSIASTTQ